MRGISRLAREQTGFGLPMSITMLAILLVVSAVAAVASIGLTNTASRDAKAKAAIAAADAGVDSAMFRLNTLVASTDSITSPLPCVVNTAGGSLSASPPSLALSATVNTDGWCNPSGPEAIGNGESFTYRMTPPLAVSADLDGLPNATLDRKVLATGTGSGVTRRVLQTVSGVNVSQMFRDLAIVAGNSLALTGASHAGTSGSPANVRSDGGISIGDTSQVCGNATPGPGGTVSLSGSGAVCSGYSTTPASYTFSVPSPSATGSSNGLLSTLCLIICPPGVSFNATTRSLTVSGALAVVTLPAGTFLNLCHVTVTNGGKIIAAASGVTSATTVRIFIDSPANCGGSSTLDVTGTGTIQNALLDPGGIQIQSAGTGAALTFNNSAGSPPLKLTVLAPDATVKLAGNTQVVGGVAGRNVNLTNDAAVSTSSSLSTIVSSALPLYHKLKYVECSTTAPNATPDSGC